MKTYGGKFRLVAISVAMVFLALVGWLSIIILNNDDQPRSVVTEDMLELPSASEASIDTEAVEQAVEDGEVVVREEE